MPFVSPHEEKYGKKRRMLCSTLYQGFMLKSLRSDSELFRESILTLKYNGSNASKFLAKAGFIYVIFQGVVQLYKFADKFCG